MDQDLLHLCRCRDCPFECVRSPVPGEGPFDTDILIVGEGPGGEEVVWNRPFVGVSGRLLDTILHASGLNRDHIRITNAALCRGPFTPEGWDSPDASVVEACFPRLAREIHLAKPKVILCLGKVAAQAVMSWDGRMRDLTGAIIWSNRWDCWTAGVWHPAAGLRGKQDYVLELYWTIQRIGKCLRGDLPWPSEPNFPITYAEDRDSIFDVLDRVRSEPILSLDLETDGLRHKRDPIFLLALCNGEEAWVIDWKPVTEDNTLMQAVRALLLTEREWRIHNYPFEHRFLKWQAGEVPAGYVKDTLAWALGLSEHGRHTSLDFCSRYYCNAPPYSFKLDPYKERKWVSSLLLPPAGMDYVSRSDPHWVDYTRLPGYITGQLRNAWRTVRYGDIYRNARDIFVRYAALDVWYGYELGDVLPELLSRTEFPIYSHDRATGDVTETPGYMPPGGDRIVKGVIEPAQKLFPVLEMRGVKTDREYLQEQEDHWRPLLREATRDLQDYAQSKGFDARDVVKNKKTPSDLNPNSYPQLFHLCFDILQLDTLEGKRTTSRKWLEKYQGHPVADKLTRIRDIQKIIATYLVGIKDDIWADGCIHPSFRIFRQATGRVTVTDPPLQVIPREGTAKKKAIQSIKRMFVARDGYYIVDMDYANLEVRWMALLSGDRRLYEAALRDMHQASAAFMFGVVEEEVTKDQRSKAKGLNFGIGYGAQPPLIAEMIKCTLAEAKEYHRRWFERYCDYADWVKKTQLFALRNHYVETLYGRRRRFPLITDRNRRDIMKQACNTPVQGGAADMNTRAALRVQPLLTGNGWGHVLFMVHDSIVMEIRREAIREALPAVKAEMEKPPCETFVEFGVDADVGETWGDCREWDFDTNDFAKPA